MKIIKSPWKNTLIDLVKNSTKSIKMTSPFIKNDICDAILKYRRSDSKIKLITNFNLMNIYHGVLDVDGLDAILDLKNLGIVKRFYKLHAKVYIFDEKRAIVTSGNLTNNGVLHNYEYGVYIDNKDILREIIFDFNSLFYSSKVSSVKKEDIEKVKEVLPRLPIKKISLETIYEDQFDFLNKNIDNEIVAKHLSGWRGDVYECIIKIPSASFTLQDIYKFEDYLKTLHPQNKHILQKIRQQLQELRDVGLIEFLGNGKYRKLWI